jgi:hypothetical protein
MPLYQINEILLACSKARTPVKEIVKAMKRSEGSLRQRALALDILAWDIAAELRSYRSETFGIRATGS